MGDRCNLVIRQSGKQIDDIWFYGHWSGFDLPTTIGQILTNKMALGRADDQSYFTRIAFDIFCPNHDEETSFGISTQLQDNEYPIAVIDLPNKLVWCIPENTLERDRLPEKLIGASWPMAAYDEQQFRKVYCP